MNQRVEFPDLTALPVQRLGELGRSDERKFEPTVFVWRSVAWMDDVLHAKTTASYGGLEVTLFGDDDASDVLVDFALLQRNDGRNEDIEFLNEDLIVQHLKNLDCASKTSMRRVFGDGNIQIPNAPLAYLFSLALLEWHDLYERCADEVLQKVGHLPSGALRIIVSKIASEKSAGT